MLPACVNNVVTNQPTKATIIINSRDEKQLPWAHFWKETIIDSEQSNYFSLKCKWQHMFGLWVAGNLEFQLKWCLVLFYQINYLIWSHDYFYNKLLSPSLYPWMWWSSFVLLSILQIKFSETCRKWKSGTLNLGIRQTRA